jgi:hypothetical protein
LTVQLRIVLCLSFVVLHYCDASALGWGGDGHQIISLIAETRLTPQAQAAIHDLLDGADISDAEICSWADEIRRQRRDTAPWHYVNIPIEADGFDPERDGNGGNNVIYRVEYFEKVLADPQADKATRAEALKFLVHFVADLHQPLHCADRNGDKGGNTRLVFFLERRRAVNLHQTWDTLILLNIKGRTRVADYADGLTANLQEVDVAKWSQGRPIDWGNESHRLCAEYVYAGIPADGDPPRIDGRYIDRAAPVIDRQLARPTDRRRWTRACRLTSVQSVDAAPPYKLSLHCPQPRSCR